MINDNVVDINDVDEDDVDDDGGGGGGGSGNNLIMFRICYDYD